MDEPKHSGNSTYLPPLREMKRFDIQDQDQHIPSDTQQQADYLLCCGRLLHDTLQAFYGSTCWYLKTISSVLLMEQD